MFFDEWECLKCQESKKQKKITNVNVNIIDTSELLAAMQAQHKEIQALRKEVQQLQNQVRKSSKK
ncbi:hypothetical protein SAMN05444487_102201 [Marininema mesophilum]|uniref:Uncharacterized protein n=1 Tax=Marininema mesophilum TaxID=1048340 RepID=A0A1H2SG10_9BACL|nr:hypothetical protein [Marininema mesophilum]SDW30457.1 hypothetical protein SAMN05444487_102201 [Marininema mesophilum]